MNKNAVISLILTVFFSMIALCFRKGKLLFLLAGYNTTSKAEKQKIDKVKVGKHFSVIIWGAAIVCFSYMLFFIYSFPSLISDSVTFVVVTITVIYLIKNRSSLK